MNHELMLEKRAPILGPARQWINFRTRSPYGHTLMMPSLFLLVFLVIFPFKIWIVIWVYSSKFRAGNIARRKKLLAELGYSGNAAKGKRIVGFFHPYW